MNETNWKVEILSGFHSLLFLFGLSKGLPREGAPCWKFTTYLANNQFDIVGTANPYLLRVYWSRVKCDLNLNVALELYPAGKPSAYTKLQRILMGNFWGSSTQNLPHNFPRICRRNRGEFSMRIFPSHFPTESSGKFPSHFLLNVKYPTGK